MRDHVQCKLRRVNGDIQVSWIPGEYARQGTFVKLKEHGAWTNGWEVVEVYSSLPSEYIFARQRDYKTHRKGTDI